MDSDLGRVHFLEEGLRVRLVTVVEHEVIKLCYGD